MLIEGADAGCVGHDIERETLEAVATRLAEVFASARAPERRGLYVASSNAGTRSALQFWKDALEKGVALANPEHFPWTLANAPCGFLAREFDVMGPNATFTGGRDALVGAWTTAADDLDAGVIDVGWIVAIDFAQQRAGETSFACVRVVREGLPGAILRPAATGDELGNGPRLSDALPSVLLRNHLGEVVAAREGFAPALRRS